MDHAKVIRSYSELLEVAQLRAFLSSGNRDELLLDIDGSEPEQKESWQRRLNDYYFECGCSMGKYFVLAALVIVSASLLTRDGGIHSVDWQWLRGFLVTVIGAAVLGKVVGVTTAYIELRGLVREIGAVCNTPSTR